MQITKAIELLLLETEHDSLTEIVIRSLAKDNSIEILKPELQTKGHRDRILSIIKIIDEIKIESFIAPMSQNVLEILTPTEISIIEKTKKDAHKEMLEARQRVRKLYKEIKDI